VRMPWLHLDGSGEVDAEVRIEHGQLAPGSRVRVPRLNARIDVLDNHIEGEAHADVRVEAGTDDRSQTRLALIVDRFRIAPKNAPDQVHARGHDLHLDVEARGPLACLLPMHAAENAAKPRCDVQPGGPATLHAQLRFEQAEVPELAAYARYLPGEGVRLLGGNGRLSGELHLDGTGEVGHGRLDLAASAARLAIAYLELEGNLQLHTKLQRVDLRRHEFELDGTRLRLERVRALDGARMLGRDWWLDAIIEHGRLRWGQPLTVDASVQAAARDVSLVLDLFARRGHYPRWALRLVDAGRAQLHGRGRLDEAGVRLDPLHAHNERFDVRARLAIRDREPSGDLLFGWGRLQAGLELVGGERRWHLLGAREWFERDGR
jgi:hypothetical protein